MGSHRKTKRGKKVAWKMDDVDWKRIEHLFPVHPVSPKGGRPRLPDRRVFEALIWFCRAGCHWEYMPKDFPGKSTCQRRLVEWEEQGILKRIHQHLLMLLDEKGRLKLEKTFMDGTFVPAKKGVNVSEKPRSARDRKQWCCPMDAASLPLTPRRFAHIVFRGGSQFWPRSSSVAHVGPISRRTILSIASAKS